MKNVLVVVFGLLMAACAADPVEAVAVSEGELTVSGGFFRQDIDVPTVDGVVHTELVFRASAVARSDRRMVAMVPGTLANGAGYYDIASGTGFDAAEVLARRGFYVLLIDLPGTGESYRPADGTSVTAAVAARAVRRAARPIALLLGVHGGVDIYGETGVGTNVGLLLARESWVRTFVGSALFYRGFGPAVAGNLFDPGFRALIASIPGGYAPQDPSFIGAFFGAADPAIQVQAVTACVGPAPFTAPTAAFIELFAIPFTSAPGPFGPTFLLDAPIVDAAPAEADALFIQGSPDPIGSETGTAEMAAVYGSTGGGEATVVTLPGASHLMRFDAAISDGPSSAFWAPLLAFLEAH